MGLFGIQVRRAHLPLAELQEFPSGVHSIFGWRAGFPCVGRFPTDLGDAEGGMKLWLISVIVVVMPMAVVATVFYEPRLRRQFSTSGMESLSRLSCSGDRLISRAPAWPACMWRLHPCRRHKLCPRATRPLAGWNTSLLLHRHASGGINGPIPSDASRQDCPGVALLPVISQRTLSPHPSVPVSSAPCPCC